MRLRERLMVVAAITDTLKTIVTFEIYYHGLRQSWMVGRLGDKWQLLFDNYLLFWEEAS